MTTTTPQSKTFRLTRHLIIGTAASLFAFSLTELCSAAEVTFAGHYTVQIPDSWTSKGEKKNRLTVDGPGGVTFYALVATTESSPEALMERITVEVTEKKPGYKFLEKGTTTSKSGHKAHLMRYNREGAVGPEMWVEYYSQLTAKEVVILVFALPMNSKPPKSEIEAIFDSVKVTTTAGKDESWTDSSAGPAATPRANTAPSAPAVPKTGGRQITFATNCSVELPAGWTGKASDNHIAATGPGGTSLDGFSEKTPMSLDSALATHLGVFEKMVGYELVDTDAVSTKAGAKGMLAFYRYNGKGGATTELAVLIEVAKSQIVTLRFLVPKGPTKLDPAFQNAVEAIFSSLKIAE